MSGQGCRNTLKTQVGVNLGNEAGEVTGSRVDIVLTTLATAGLLISNK